MSGGTWDSRGERFSRSLDEKKAATGTGFSHEVMTLENMPEVDTVVQDRDSSAVPNRN